MVTERTAGTGLIVREESWISVELRFVDLDQVFVRLVVQQSLRMAEL
jgi:hypothetical protein